MKTNPETSGADHVLRWAGDYAPENGRGMNPDRRTLTAAVRGLALNEARFGARFCLSRLPYRKEAGGTDEMTDTPPGENYD